VAVAESGVEAALECALRHPLRPMAVAVAVAAMRVTVIAVCVTVVVTASAVPAVLLAIVTVEAVPGLEVPVSEAVSGTEAVPGLEVPGSEAVSGSEAVPVPVPAAESVPGAEAEPGTPLPGERSLLVPVEGASDLLECSEGRRHLLVGDGAGDLRADAVDGGAETFLRRAAFLGECPPVAVRFDPAAVDEVVQLVRVQRAALGRRAVDDVQRPPVATGRALRGEGGGEFLGHQAIHGLEPVAERTGAVVRGVVCRGVHGDPSWSVVHR